MREKKQANIQHQLLNFDDMGNLTRVQDVQLFQPIKKRRFRKGEFIMQSFEYDKLILEKNYPGLTFRVLSALKLRYNYNNEIKHFTQKELAQQLKTSQANISKELKRLMDDKIIIKLDNVYYFNKKYFSGSGDE